MRSATGTLRPGDTLRSDTGTIRGDSGTLRGDTGTLRPDHGTGTMRPEPQLRERETNQNLLTLRNKRLSGAMSPINPESGKEEEKHGN